MRGVAMAAQCVCTCAPAQAWCAATFPSRCTQVAVYQVGAGHTDAFLVLVGREDGAVAVVRVSDANVTRATDAWASWFGTGGDALVDIVRLMNRYELAGERT